MLDKAIERRNKDAVMGLGEHLEELRKRVLLAVIVIAPLFAVCLVIGDRLLRIAVEPAVRALHKAGETANFQLNNPIEAFGAYVKVAAIITIAIAGPWILFQGWKFIAPGLYAKERRFVYVLAPFSSFMALAGLAFAYFVVIPIMLGFLLEFNATTLDTPIKAAPLPDGVVLKPTIPVLEFDPIDPPVGSEWINTTLLERRVCIGLKDGKPDIVTSPLSHSNTIAQQFRLKETIDLIIMTCLTTVGGFQTPVVVLLLGWAGIVSPKVLSKYRKHALLVCAVLGAVLTPSPDPFSMCVVFVPMYLLYELGLILVILLPAHKIAGAKPEEYPGGPADGP